MTTATCRRQMRKIGGWSYTSMFGDTGRDHNTYECQLCGHREDRVDWASTILGILVVGGTVSATLIGVILLLWYFTPEGVGLRGG